MRITWGAAFIILLIVIVILCIIKAFIWEIIGIGAIIALVVWLRKRFGNNR